MASKLILKKSSVPAKVPVVGDLEYGELALNYADGKLFYKTANNTISSFNVGGGGGASALDDLTDVVITSANTGQVLQYNGTNWVNASAAGGIFGGTFVNDSFTGTGSQTQFTLTATPQSINCTFVNINGVYQLKSSYSVATNVLTFSEAPANGASIEVLTIVSAQAGTIAVGTVTTGAAGSNATVTNSGTSTQAVFDFVIPQGATGAQGPQGPQGPQGDPGVSPNTGTATLTFGNFPGSNETSLAVTGQTTIASTAKIKVYVVATTTADHTVNDHTYLPLFAQFTAGNIVAGTGFTIYGRSTEKLQGTFKVNWEWSN